MKKFSVLVISMLCTLFAIAQYSVTSLPNPRNYNANAYVANPDGVLSYTEENELNEIAAKIYRAVEVELCVVAVNAINSDDAFDFSVQLFNHWGIGDAKKNTGVMILLVKDSRDIQIRTGGGVEGILTDALCTSILNNVMIPILKNDLFGHGLIEGAKEIGRQLTTQNAQAELLLGYTPKPVSQQPWSLLSIISLLFAGFKTGRYYTLPKCPKCNKRGCKIAKSILAKPTYEKTGMGLTTYTCENCSHQWSKPYTIARLVDTSTRPIIITGGGRGPGGFSGGSFGGGMTFGGGAGGKF